MNTFDKELHTYLSTPINERDITAGASLLLQLNRNAILHANIVRQPDKMAPLLFYELNKYAKLRKINLNEAMEILDEKGINVGGLDVKEKKHESGKRKDHDLLPEAIQNLYVENGPLLGMMREVFGRLKTAKTDCDRKELLYQLYQLDDKYRDNWAIYDAYDLSNNEKSQEESNDQEQDDEDKTLDVTDKDIANYRSYISKNKPKLKELKADESSQAEYVKLLAKIEARARAIVASGKKMTDELKSELMDLGVRFE